MKKIAFFAAVLGFAALTGCSKEGPVNTSEIEKGNVEITLLNGNGGATRADLDPVTGSDSENKVAVVEIYVFNDAGATLDTGASADGYVKLSPNTSTFPYTTQVQMTAGTNKDVIVVANANLGDPAAIATAIGGGKTAATLTFDDIMGRIAAAEMSRTNSRTVPTDGFIMSGHTLNAVVAPERSDNVIKVPIDRAVARIEYPTTAVGGPTFELEQDELDDIFGKTGDTSNVTSDDNLTFTLSGYAVINGFVKTSAGFVGNKITTDGAAGTTSDVTYSVGNKPYLKGGTDGTSFYSWNLWLETNTVVTAGVPVVTEGAWEIARGRRLATNANALIALPDTDPDKTDASKWENAYSGKVGAEWFIPATETNKNVYVYESKPSTKSDEAYAGYDPDGVIAVILKGEIKDNTSSVSKTRYWRVNVRVNDAYHIIRNSTYQTAINKIVSPGYSPPQEAETEDPIVAKPDDTVAEFQITVNPWIIRQVGNEI